MDMKRKFRWGLAFALLLSGIAFAGLETVTHIQDLNASWPLGSDLASTSDDHLRNIKSALKTDFPNMNGTVNSAAAPVFGVPGDADTGLYESAANDVALSAGGTKALDCTSTVCTINSVNVSGSTVPTIGIYTPSANALSFASNSLIRGTVSSAGAWSLPAPTAGTTLTLTGLANANTMVVQGSGTSSQSFGMRVVAGTNSSDSSVVVRDSTDAFTTFQVRGDAAIFGRGATAAAVVDMSPDKGTFTATYTGFTASSCSPVAACTGTASWAKMGQVVVLTLPQNLGTSNATTFTTTGLPAAIQPSATTQTVAVVVENNTAEARALAQFASASGTITYSVWAAGGFNASNWTASGNKGIATPLTITYALN